MNTYITQLIELIDEAVAKSPISITMNGDSEEEYDQQFAEEFLQGKPEKISVVTGIERYNFPNAEQLSPKQLSNVLKATEELLRAYNWEFMFPENVTEKAKYQFIIDNWNTEHIFCQKGVVQIETCKFNEDQCPFPKHCQVCHSFKCNKDSSHHLSKGLVDFSQLSPDLNREEDTELREEINRFKALIKQPKNLDYIVGIHNYCDGRCERCDFTSKCSSFALHEELNYSDNSDSESCNHQLTAIFRATSELIEEELTKKGISIEQAMADMEHLELHSTTKHTLELQAESYAEKVNRWFESNQMELESRIITEKEPEIRNCFESITWFQLFIPAKISRAVKGICKADQTECDIYDAHGSAKIALIAMDECITAWENIMAFIPRKEDSILNMLRHLSKLRHELENYIPEARQFIRPGFDE
jgi:hypothetical protein